MPSLDKRITKLEDMFLQHLAESGEIRGDLKWLKKAFWTLASLVGTGFVKDILHTLWR